MPISLTCDNSKIILSSLSRTYKTSLFIKETKNFAAIDGFLSVVAQAIVLNYSLIEQKACTCFKIECKGGEHSLFFVTNKATHGLNKQDIVFFKYLGKEGFVRKNDGRLRAIMSAPFEISVQATSAVPSEECLAKLYVLTNSAAHFPLLNEQQRGIVAIEDQNVLVQGVAGSGKTNVCIDKIIFSACRGYAGRVLYSTFSKGLLLDTQARVSQFRQNLLDFIAQLQRGNVIFADDDHKKAIENRLLIYFSTSDDQQILKKINEVAQFLDQNVDYFLLEDLYKKHCDCQQIKTAGENYFIKEYLGGIKNHQLSAKLDKIKHLSFEVIYKEIFGMIFGCFNPQEPQKHLSHAQYRQKREGSFSHQECDLIYALALDYATHLSKNNLLDNNLISRSLLQISHKIKKYSLTVLDEVQDLTEASLNLFKAISIKLFCVGDALQMINPSYFSFAYLKRLMFKKDIVSVAQLSHNYRSTKRIAQLCEQLGQINIRQFGTHSFVLRGQSTESEVPTLAAFVNDPSVFKLINQQECNNFTVITATIKEKERLRHQLPNAEILTVSEAKGLERDVVILHNVLSSNYDKWMLLQRISLNRKGADENSVFRYYFNLFYVGVSRAKTHIYVVEERQIPLFKDFFKDCLIGLSGHEAAKNLMQTSDKTEQEQDSLIERVAEFVRLEQFDNARFWAQKIISEQEKTAQLGKIDIYQQLVFKGNNRQAGIKLWELGLVAEAREQFIVADEQVLLQLIDASAGDNQSQLSADIVDFLPQVSQNEAAVKLILHWLSKDLAAMQQKQKLITTQLKKQGD